MDSFRFERVEYQRNVVLGIIIIIIADGIRKRLEIIKGNCISGRVVGNETGRYEILRVRYRKINVSPMILKKIHFIDGLRLTILLFTFER